MSLERMKGRAQQARDESAKREREATPAALEEAPREPVPLESWDEIEGPPGHAREFTICHRCCAVFTMRDGWHKDRVDENGRRPWKAKEGGVLFLLHPVTGNTLLVYRCSCVAAERRAMAQLHPAVPGWFDSMTATEDPRSKILSLEKYEAWRLKQIHQGQGDPGPIPVSL